MNHSLLKSLPAVSIYAIRLLPATVKGDGSALNRQLQITLLETRNPLSIFFPPEVASSSIQKKSSKTLKVVPDFYY
jgi:hypothetical protein